MIGKKIVFAQGGSGSIYIPKDLIGKEIVVTDELTEDEVRLFVLFKKVKRGWN